MKLAIFLLMVTVVSVTYSKPQKIISDGVSGGIGTSKGATGDGVGAGHQKR